MSQQPQEKHNIVLDEIRIFLLDPDTPTDAEPPHTDYDPNPKIDPGE